MKEETQKENSEISVAEVIEKTNHLIRYLRTKWLTILLISLAGGIVGVTYAWLKQPVYEAALSFSTFEEKSSGGGLAGLAAQFGINVGSAGDVFNGDNLLALIHSKRILTRSLLQIDTIDGKQTNLLNYYIEVSADKKKDDNTPPVSFPLQQPLSTYNRQQDSILNGICEDLLKSSIVTSRMDKKLELFQITCTTKNELFSRLLALQLIKQVSSFYIETKTKRSAQTVDVLQKRADSIRLAYNNALSGRATLADANINAALQGPVVSIQKKQTDITVLVTAYTEIIKNLELAKFNLLQNTPLVQVIDEPVMPLKKIKASRLLTGIIAAFILGSLSITYLGFKYASTRNLNKQN